MHSKIFFVQTIKTKNISKNIIKAPNNKRNTLNDNMLTK